MERDLVGGDPDDPELAEELLALVPELLDEGVVGRPSPERLARVAVDVRDHQVDLLLRERIEGRAFLQDPPELQVEALDVRLLRGAVGVAVEHADAAGLEPVRVVDRVGPVVLDHLRVAELGAVVEDEAAEHAPEEARPRELPEHVVHARAGLRGLRVPQERQRQHVVHGHREEDLSADGSDDGVAFGRHDVRMLGEPCDPVGLRPADAASGVRLGLGLPVRSPARSGEGEVMPLRAEQPVVDPAVDRAFRVSREELGVAAHHGDDGLPVPDGWRQHGVHPGDGLVVGADSRARGAERALVVRLRGGCDVVALRQRAVALVLAPVADVRRLREPVARGLAEVGA